MEPELLTKTRALLAAIERGDRDSLLALYAEDAVQIEYPNRLKPKGDRRGPAKMAEDLARGKRMLRSEHYEIVNAVVSEDRVAVQIAWTGVLAVPIGASAAGDQMRASSGIFLRFRDGRIAEQHNYDCFEDFLAEGVGGGLQRLSGSRFQAQNGKRRSPRRLRQNSSVLRLKGGQEAVVRLSAADLPVRLSLTIS